MTDKTLHGRPGDLGHTRGTSAPPQACDLPENNAESHSHSRALPVCSPWDDCRDIVNVTQVSLFPRQALQTASHPIRTKHNPSQDQAPGERALPAPQAPPGNTGLPSVPNAPDGPGLRDLSRAQSLHPALPPLASSFHSSSVPMLLLQRGPFLIPLPGRPRPLSTPYSA